MPKTGTKQYRVQISKREDFNPLIEQKTTDNPDYAPPLTSSYYSAGGTFYWRVAAIDGDGNVGTYANNPAHFTLPTASGGGTGPKHFKVTFTGRLVKNRTRDIAVKVRDATTLNALQGALVRAYGAGVPLTQQDDELERRGQVPAQADAAQEGHVPREQAHVRDGLHRPPRLSPLGLSPRRLLLRSRRARRKAALRPGTSRAPAARRPCGGRRPRSSPGSRRGRPGRSSP